jgi:DNA-binding GntR family transcriptional regulator
MGMTLKIIKPALYVEVTERLRSMIASGFLEPGSWVDEQKLAEDLEGLLRIEPRRGCYVTQLTEKDLDDIFPIMAMLEGRCAFEAAQRATDKDIHSLEALHGKLEKHAQAKNIDEYYETNRKIHIAIQNLAGNEWLSRMLQDMRKILNLSRHRSLHGKGRIAESCAEHLSVFAALKARDPLAAEVMMKTHIMRQRDVLKNLVPGQVAS